MRSRGLPLCRAGALLAVTMAACCSLTASVPARAIEPPAVVGLHLVSVHSSPASSAPGSYGWNDRNFGLYARWSSGFTAGAFRNSLFRTTAYAGWTFTDRADRFGLTVGLASGYDRLVASGGDHQAVRCEATCRTVNLRSVYVPILVPSVRVPLTDHASARLALVAGPRQPTALHLSFEWKL